ncbi:junctional adhesion molecule A-like isoform X2 [Chiloscyllium punctatum]|uniref:junctional adhesion molecule A-like isoform X2 n=1 Tax=Chiloscyllium punctatum TaxID=137246 RepID=UPI003B63C5F5
MSGIIPSSTPPSEPFSVTADNPIITINHGTPADLLCRHSPDFGPNPDVAWLFTKQDGSREMVYFKGQLSVYYKKQIQRFPWGLRINVTRVRDSGIYKCMVWTQDGSHLGETEITLNVKLPQYTRANVTTNTHRVEVPIGGSAELTCLFSPEYGMNARINWRLIRTDGSVDVLAFDRHLTWPYNDRIASIPYGLHMKKLFPYDSGTYTCEVTSQDGKLTGQVAIQLHVKAPPSEPFSVTADNPIITTRRGTPADLLCRHSPEFGPNPDVAWVFTKQDGSREMVYFKGQLSEKYRKWIKRFPWGLRIDMTRVTDSGTYRCMVWSQDGSHLDEVEITLNVRRSSP